jgi:hypothetical protein
MDVERYAVIIAGGGPAGLAAGLFTARYGLRTLILDRGKSSLRQCAYLENYLGFPGGIGIPAFLDLSRAQVIDAGCEIVHERVTALEFGGNGRRFRVRTHKGSSYCADRFIAATVYDTEYLQGLATPALFESDGQSLRRPDAHGRTAVAGLYLAGPLAGVENEALISAGQAAQAALGLIRDIRYGHGLWDAIAHYLDWQVWQGCCEGEDWVERVHRYFKNSVPEQAGLDAARVREIIDQWIAMKRARQLDQTEVRWRGERGRRMLADRLALTAPDKRRPGIKNAGTRAPAERN